MMGEHPLPFDASLEAYERQADALLDALRVGAGDGSVNSNTGCLIRVDRLRGGM